jgi:hypothetical protein
MLDGNGSVDDLPQVPSFWLHPVSRTPAGQITFSSIRAKRRSNLVSLLFLDSNPKIIETGWLNLETYYICGDKPLYAIYPLGIPFGMSNPFHFLEQPSLMSIPSLLSCLVSLLPTMSAPPDY